MASTLCTVLKCLFANAGAQEEPVSKMRFRQNLLERTLCPVTCMTMKCRDALQERMLFVLNLNRLHHDSVSMMPEL
jgi:hypothetical protein